MQEKKRVSRHIFLLPCRAAGRARNAMTHDQIPPHLLATLEPGDRALFEERTDHLTSDQAFRRQELAAQINRTYEIASESREARDSRIIAERRARDIPARIASDLNLRAELKDAPAAAFYELARKIAKAIRAGKPALYDRSLKCLADDADCSLRSAQTMRAIGKKRGWFHVEQQPRRQNDEGKWRQEPSIYRPAPILWKAISFILTGTYTGVQNFAQTWDINISQSNIPHSDTSARKVKKGAGAYRDAYRVPAPTNLPRNHRDIAPYAQTSVPPKGCSGTSKTNCQNSTPQNVDPMALRQSLAASLTALTKIETSPTADAAELIAKADALRCIHAPDITDANWNRAISHRGLWAALALAFTLTKQFSARAKVKTPAGCFNWCTWTAPRTLEDPLAAIEHTLAFHKTTAAEAISRHALQSAVSWLEELPAERKAALEARFAPTPRGRRPFAIWVKVAHSATIRNAKDRE